MADHINISQPDRFFEERTINERKHAAERERLTEIVESYRNDLDSIFIRIGAGETVELHYRDGKIIIVGEKGERRKR